MCDEKPFEFNSPSVQTHLTILQGIITRMSTLSTVCKTLCVTIVAIISSIATAVNVQTPYGYHCCPL